MIKFLQISMFMFLATNFILSVGNQAHAYSPQAKVLTKEFFELKTYLQINDSNILVGGLYKAKSFGNYKILWKFENGPGAHEVIRIYRPATSGSDQDFSVTYYKTSHIIPGRTVIRRFIGPDVIGWRNDTIDLMTGQYLGSQGVDSPVLSETDKKILKTWAIQENI